MSKKKILSILMISLVVIGVTTFVLTNYLHADCSDDLAECTVWCTEHTYSPGANDACQDICIGRFAKCLAK